MNVFAKLAKQWVGLPSEDIEQVRNLQVPTRNVARNYFESVLDDVSDDSPEIAIPKLLDLLNDATPEEAEEIQNMLRIFGYVSRKNTERIDKTADLKLSIILRILNRLKQDEGLDFKGKIKFSDKPLPGWNKFVGDKNINVFWTPVLGLEGEPYEDGYPFHSHTISAIESKLNPQTFYQGYFGNGVEMMGRPSGLADIYSEEEELTEETINFFLDLFSEAEEIEVNELNIKPDNPLSLSKPSEEDNEQLTLFSSLEVLSEPLSSLRKDSEWYDESIPFEELQISSSPTQDNHQRCLFLQSGGIFWKYENYLHNDVLDSMRAAGVTKGGYDVLGFGEYKQDNNLLFVLSDDYPNPLLSSSISKSIPDLEGYYHDYDQWVDLKEVKTSELLPIQKEILTYLRSEPEEGYVNKFIIVNGTIYYWVPKMGSGYYYDGLPSHGDVVKALIENNQMTDRDEQDFYMGNLNLDLLEKESGKVGPYGIPNIYPDKWNPDPSDIDYLSNALQGFDQVKWGDGNLAPIVKISEQLDFQLDEDNDPFGHYKDISFYDQVEDYNQAYKFLSVGGQYYFWPIQKVLDNNAPHHSEVARQFGGGKADMDTAGYYWPEGHRDMKGWLSDNGWFIPDGSVTEILSDHDPTEEEINYMLSLTNSNYISWNRKDVTPYNKTAASPVDLSQLNTEPLEGANKFVIDIPSETGFFWPLEDYSLHHAYVVRALGYDPDGEGLSPDYEAPVLMGYYNNSDTPVPLGKPHSIEVAEGDEKMVPENIQLLWGKMPNAIAMNWNGTNIEKTAVIEDDFFSSYPIPGVENKFIVVDNNVYFFDTEYGDLIHEDGILKLLDRGILSLEYEPSIFLSGAYNLSWKTMEAMGQELNSGDIIVWDMNTDEELETSEFPDFLIKSLTKTAATINEDGTVGFQGDELGNKHKFILTPEGEFYAWGKKDFDYGKGMLAIENEGTLYDELDDFTKYEWNIDASDTYDFYRQQGYATGQTSSGSFFMLNAPSGLNEQQIEAVENLFRQEGYRNIVIHENGTKHHFNRGVDAINWLSPRRNEEREEFEPGDFFEGKPEEDLMFGNRMKEASYLFTMGDEPIYNDPDEVDLISNEGKFIIFELHGNIHPMFWDFGDEETSTHSHFISKFSDSLHNLIGLGYWSPNELEVEYIDDNGEPSDIVWNFIKQYFPNYKTLQYNKKQYYEIGNKEATRLNPGTPDKWLISPKGEVTAWDSYETGIQHSDMWLELTNQDPSEDHNSSFRSREMIDEGWIVGDLSNGYMFVGQSLSIEQMTSFVSLLETFIQDSKIYAELPYPIGEYNNDIAGLIKQLQRDLYARR